MPEPSDEYDEDVDGPQDDGWDDDDGDDTPPAPEGRMARLERMLAPKPPPPPRPGAKEKTTKWSIDRIDGRERLYGYVAGVAAPVFAGLIYAAETHKHLKPVKGQLSPETSLIVGVLGGIMLLGASRIGRRALVGFAALFTFLSFSSNIFIGLPFLVLAGWLLFRSYKVQKEATAKLRADKAAARDAGDSARTARTPRAAAASGRTAAKARTSSRKKGPTGPEANKRYTPKRPAPPPPPPPKQSRRERKAAGAD